MSRQERVSWLALVVNAIIGAVYFQRVLSLPATADLFGLRMAGFAFQLIALSIVVSIVCELALRLVRKGEGSDPDRNRTDERVTLINLKARRNAHAVLWAGMFAALVQITLLEWAQRFGHGHSVPQTVLGLMVTGPLAPMHIAQVLLLVMTLAGITVYASRIFYCRRGY
ncbi:MAG: hypothetical protein ABI616_09935 [Pseudomonadota bacterium]